MVETTAPIGVVAMKPTHEQSACVDSYRDASCLLIEAGAGTGKTSTLRMCADSQPGRKSLYLAYNRSIADEAKRSFPRNVTVKTVHSFALWQLKAKGIDFSARLAGANRGQTALSVAHFLNVRPYRSGIWNLTNIQVARAASAMVKQFTQTADEEIGLEHVPDPETVGIRPTDSNKQRIIPAPEEMVELAELLLPYAKGIWEDVSNPLGDKFRFQHNYYLKVYQLMKQQIPYDSIFLDEAQDANPVMAALADVQQSQVVLVGDSAQGINEWNGAVDVLERFKQVRQHELRRLSQSWRFGEGIADLANTYLEKLGSSMRLQGNPAKADSAIPPADYNGPLTVLCRTNATAIDEALTGLATGLKVHVVGGTEDMVEFARAAEALKSGAKSYLPELSGFETWGDVQDYVANDPEGEELKKLVDMVDTYGPATIINQLSRSSVEEHAQLVVSTAHKAKGREWPFVRIGSDFRIPTDEKPLTDQEIKLRYVATTRSQGILDVGPLVFDHPFIKWGHVLSPKHEMVELASQPKQTVTELPVGPKPTGSSPIWDEWDDVVAGW